MLPILLLKQVLIVNRGHRKWALPLPLTQCHLGGVPSTSAFFSTNAPGSKVSKEEPDWLNLRTIVPAWFEGFRGASQSSGTVESGSDCSEHSEE